MRWYGQRFGQRRAIQVSFEVIGEPVRLPAEYETVLFRITQEAFTNIAKHAQATAARLTVEFDPGLIKLSIQDNGQGFDPEARPEQERGVSGWGLMGMQERAALVGGRLRIESQPGQGTLICVEVPFATENEHGGQDQAVIGG